jgi:methylglyoxal reductase
MRYRPLGASGIETSVVGLGTWAMGGWKWGGTNEAEAIEAIRASINAGVTLIDTAPAYGMGLAEEIVGKAVAGRRDKVILASKCGLAWHTTAGEYFFHQQDKPVHRHLGPESIRYEVEQSLKRLGTDYIDLYQTHWQDSTTPIQDTMAALLDLKEEGKIRAIGVSNVNVEQLEEYWQVGPVDSDQERFNMLDRDAEAELLPYCRQKGMAMLAYSSLALGLLTGKIGPDRQFPGDDQRSENPRFSVENRRKVAAMLESFKPIAQSYGLTIAQLVIAWTVAQPGVTHALCGARNARQAVENAHAGDVNLTADELSAMDEAIQKHAAVIP